MTYLDLQEAFLTELKDVTSIERNPFITREINEFLNNAQNQYINALADLYERKESVRKSLTNLTKGAVLTEDVSYPNEEKILDYSHVYDLPGDAMRVVQEQVFTVGGELIKIKPFTHDQFNINISNPYKEPYEDLVWRLDVGGKHELIPAPGTTLGEYKIRYIILPTEIDVTIDGEAQLPDKDMENIVGIATEMALRSISHMADTGQSKKNDQS